MPGIVEFVLGLNPVIRQGDTVEQAYTRPLVRYLTRALNVPVRIVVEPDYATLIAAMKADEIDAALLGEYAFYVAQLDAGAEALAVSVETGSDEAATYQSVIIARDDAPIHDLSDVRGSEVGFVDRNSTSGYLIPRRMLREAGLDPDSDIVPRYFASHPAVAEAVLAGDVPVGALHGAQLQRVLADRSADAGRIRTVAMSPPIPKGPFAVRRGLDREIRQRLLQALLAIHEAAPDAARILLSPGTHWRPTSNRHVTLKTVAALSGVSYGTVSRVINGRAHVAPETYARVMSIVHDLGYRPNAAAVSLIANRSDLVGFIVPDASDPAISRQMTGIQRALAEEGMHAVLCPVGNDRAREQEFLSLLDDGRFGGLILTAWSSGLPAVSTLAAAGRALVFLGVSAGSAPVPSVAANVETAVDAAIAHLSELGHTAIGACVSAMMRGSVVRRFEALGLPTTDILDIGNDDASETFVTMRDHYSDAPWPTALICGTDAIALGVLQAAAASGRRIPDDLSLLALNESWLAPAMTPPLTTIATDVGLLGERAAMLLIEQMSGGERRAEPFAPPAPLLMIRASTAPPKRTGR